MRKILLSILLCAFAVATWAQTSQVRLVFERTDQNVTVAVKDQDGNAIPGASATVALSGSTWKSNGILGNLTNVICPDVNANTNPTITMTFTINGLSKLMANRLSLDIHAMNGGGNYQDNKDNVTRQWNVKAELNESDYADVTDIEISQGTESGRGYSIENPNHKIHELNVLSNAILTNPSTFVLTITKGNTNGGCFFGLSEIILGVEELPEPESPKVFNVKGQITASDLMAKTEPTYIAMRNISITNDNWFTGEVSSPDLIVFVWEPATDGKFYLKRYADGLYLQESTLSLGEQDAAAQFEAICPTTSGSGKNQFNGDQDVNPYIAGISDASSYYVRFVKADALWINVQNNGSLPLYNEGKGSWTIQHVYEVTLADAYTVNITDAKYATFFAASECEVPEGVTAYYATTEDVDVENTKINLREVENIIPANTGVILYTETAGDYTFNASNTGAAELAGNLLKGTPASMNICMDHGQSAYVLSKQNSVIGLYMAEMTTANGSEAQGQRDVFLNNAKKAYLPASALPTVASVQGFKFGDFTSTAIEGVATGNENAKVIYDLSGRRINDITSGGVYIINGKKVMVK